MRNLKRALSVALASVMLLGMMVVGTGASSYSDVADNNDYIEAIEVLKAVGVMGGDDQGKFNPDASVTRAEMAVIMTNMLGLNPDDYAGTNPFTDVPDWAANYVAACYANDIVGGVGDNKFDPNGKITAVQAALMMQKALGYFQYASDYGADWSETMVKVSKLASQISMWKNVSGVTVNTELTRGQVAQVALNALKATTVDAELISGGIEIGDIVINERVEYNKVMNSDKSYNAMNTDKSAKDEYTVELGEKLFDCKLKVETSASTTDDFGAPATVWTYKADTVGKFANTEPVLSYTADFDKDELKDLKDDGYDFASANVYVNGVKDVDGATSVDAVAERNYKGTVVELYADADDAKKITNVVVRQGYFAKVTDLDDESISLDVYNPWAGKTAENVTFDDDSKKSDDSYDQLAAKYEEDDTLIVYFKGADVDSSMITFADTTSFEGKIATTKITESDGYNGYFTVDGEKYNLASGYTEATVLKAGDEYTFYQDENGYVIAAETIKEAATAIGDVYYVDNVWEEVNYVSGAQVKSYYAQLVALDGTVSEIELEDYEANTSSDWNKTLVTISDKKHDDFKGGNSKYDLKAWEPNSEKDWDLYDGVKFSANFAKDSTRIASDKGTFRLNSKTEYLFVEGSANKLETTVYTGGVAFNSEKIKKAFVITEDGSMIAQYVVIYTNDADQAQTFSDDAIYVAKQSSEKGDGYRAQEVYYADGSKETINIAETEYPLSAGFYTYDTDEDGNYVLQNANKMEITAGVWKDAEGTITDATMGKKALFDGLLTVTADGKLVEDIETEGAAFVDTHDKDAGYSKSVDSLEALAELINDGKVGEVKLSMNVSKDGAVIIVVTSIAKA